MGSRSTTSSALLALALCIAACTIPAAEDERAVTPSNAPAPSSDVEPMINEPRVLPVEILRVTNDATIEALVARPCGDRRVELVETSGTVEFSFVDDWQPGPNEACGMELAMESERIELDTPIGGRSVVVEVPPYLFEPDRWDHPCLIIDDAPSCQTLTIRSLGDERTIDEFDVSVIPIDIDTSSASNTIGLSNGWSFDLTLPDWPANPILAERRPIFRPDLMIHGSVTVHNVDRDLTGLERVDDINGFRAHAIRPPQSPNEAPQGVTLDVGEWFIDLFVWGSDPADSPDAMATVLDAIVIEPQIGQMPLISDPIGYVGDRTELIVTDLDGRGLTLSFTTECISEEPSCVPGIGFLSSGGTFESAVAETPVTRRPWDVVGERADVTFPLDGVSVGALSFGTLYPLQACDGIPWYPIELQPKGMALSDLMHENWQQSGIRDWIWQYRPDEISGFIGAANAPEAVVRFAEVQDDRWDVVSVTRCQ